MPFRKTTAFRSAALTTMDKGPFGDFSGCHSYPVEAASPGTGLTIAGAGAIRGVTFSSVITTVIPSLVAP